MREGQVVVISHSEELDPGLAFHCIQNKKDVIVFESVQGYVGYELLYECHPFVRSSVSIKLPLVLSRPYMSVSIPHLVKLARFKKFLICDPKVLPYMKVFSALIGEKPVVNGTTVKVRTLLRAMKYQLGEVPQRSAVAYYDTLPMLSVCNICVKYGFIHGGEGAEG